MRQERLQATRTRSILEHVDDIHFVLNTSSLHNHQYIKSAVPPDLYGSSFSVESVPELRRKAAENIRKKKVQQALKKKIQKALKQGQTGEWGLLRKFVVEGGGASQSSDDEDNDELPVFDRGRARAKSNKKKAPGRAQPKKKPRSKADPKRKQKAVADSDADQEGAASSNDEGGNQAEDPNLGLHADLDKGKGKRRALDEYEDEDEDAGGDVEEDYDNMDESVAGERGSEDQTGGIAESPAQQSRSSDNNSGSAGAAPVRKARGSRRVSYPGGSRAPAVQVAQPEEVSTTTFVV